MTQEEEKYCLQELSQGNKQAYEWLFITWQPRLVSFFYGFLDDEDLAKDYAQDIFYDIWTSRRKFSQVESFSAYLFQMARFKMYNHFDKLAVMSKFRKEMMTVFPFTSNSQETYMYASETEAAIWMTVKRLPAKRRKVFILSRLWGYTNDQIAAELGISKRTVENHITYVLAALRKKIK